MTGRLALAVYLFGHLELGFVLLVANVLPTWAFVLWSGLACIALMVLGLVEWLEARAYGRG